MQTHQSLTEPSRSETIKDTLYTVFYLVLVARFLLLLGDPGADGHSDVASIQQFYGALRGPIDVVYHVSDIIRTPIAMVWNAIITIIPSINVSWFPVLTFTAVATWLKEFAASNPDFPLLSFFTAQIKQMQPANLTGVFDWLVFVCMAFIATVGPMLEKAFELVKNLVWSFFIEMSFTKRKEGQYKEALDKNAQDFRQLNVEYRNLSQEASQLKTSVITDELTKVHNKRFFLQKMKESFATAKQGRQKFALIVSDIDHFKKLNDTYGHLMGDQVLKAVAQAVKKATPAQAFCCRFGGEEFCVIMPNVTEMTAMEVATNIKMSVPMLRFQEDPELKVTISQGLTYIDFSSPEADALQTADDVIKLADDELYRAKLDGRDRISFKKID